MNALFEAGLELQSFFESRKWRFCFIGGLAVIRWGEIRTTQDIDLSLFVGFGDEKKYIVEILKQFRSRVSSPMEFALDNRVLLIRSSNDVDVDISLSGLPFEEQMIDRATPFEYLPGCRLRTCSPEDLIVLKAFADRSVDWADIEGIVMRQGGRLNTDDICENIAPLCELKDTPEIVDRLKALLPSI